MAFLKVLDSHGHKIPANLSSYSSYSGAPFEAATFTRRLQNWGTSTSGPDAPLFSSLSTLRARSRELVRNEPIIDGGIDTLVSNLVGTGISPRWQMDDAKLKKELQQLWGDWVFECDYDGVADFYGLQTLATRCMIESGEVLIRLLPGNKNGLTVPLQLQVIEPDHLDETYTTQASNGNEIRIGIEFNKSGQRVAYHLFKEHPGEHYLNGDNTNRIRVPASDILHIYRPLRPGQKRGRPWLSSVITIVHELNKYLDAESVRKSGAAMFGGFITTPPGESENVPNIFGQNADNPDPQIIALEPGSFPSLPPGMDVKFSERAEVGNSYDPFVKHQERRISRGMGLSYTQTTGDLSDAKYSTIRASNIEFQRFCKQIISNVIAFQLCRPVAKYWVQQAALSGAINLPNFLADQRKYYRINWIHDGFALLDPSKEVKPKIDEIRAGLNTRTNVLAEKGLDVEAVDQERAAENKNADSLEIRHDSDPRYDQPDSLKGSNSDE